MRVAIVNDSRMAVEALRRVVAGVPHLDLAWIALDAGPDNRHNPFVKRADVKKLLSFTVGSTPTNPGQCTHALCSTGGALTGSCDPCAAKVCAADPFCCTSGWDNLCVSGAKNLCSLTCN